MKQQGYVHISLEKGEEKEHKFCFEMPMGASYADAADAAYSIFKTVDKMYRDAIDKEIAQKEEEQKEA